MPKVFLVSDTHLGHRNIVNFTKADGSKLRPWYSIQEHDEALIQYWNETVKPTDKVYHLGDSHFGERGAEAVRRLNGNKVLIGGNHDADKSYALLRDLYSKVVHYHQMAGLLLSHIPVHESQFHRWRGNLHGHLHSASLSDPRYLCVSVEHTNFRPILFEEVLSKWEKRNQ